MNPPGEMANDEWRMTKAGRAALRPPQSRCSRVDPGPSCGAMLLDRGGFGAALEGSQAANRDASFGVRAERVGPFVLPASAFFRHFPALALLALTLSASAQPLTNSAAELDLKKLQVAPGLKVELFAAEPMVMNPVAFSIDERGRFFIAETHRWGGSVFDITKELPWLLNDLSFRTVEQRAEFLTNQFATNLARLTNRSELIRLVEDRAGTGRADTSSVFAEGFNSPVSGAAAGILARQGEVWFTSIPDLWKISSAELGRTNAVLATNAPVRPDTRHSSFAISNLTRRLGVHIGVSGHDAHGVIMGPDGRLYFSVGDRGFAPPADIRGFGFTSAFLKRVLPDTGAVFRCNPDGTGFEVFCLGLRNPQELAFDALGNLFTVDNDTTGPDEPRLLHLVEGGDYGWRCSYQHMKNFGPWCEEEVWRGGIDDVLPWSGKVAQGPCGFAFYPGTGLPESYQGKFLVCDVPGGVWSFSVKPRGASFEVATREKFLWNCWPTDVAFGPDGAVYVSDWVGGWGQPDKGRIYRITDPAQAGSAKLTEVGRLMREGMKQWHVAFLDQWLGHADIRVRMEAQSEMADRHSKSFIYRRDVAERGQNQLARIHAMQGMVTAVQRIIGPPKAASWQGSALNFDGVVDGGVAFGAYWLEPMAPLLADKDSEIRAQVLHLAWPCLLVSHGPELAPSEPAQQLHVLIKLLKDQNSRVRFFALQNLGKLWWRAAIPAALEALRANADSDAYLTHAGVMALIGIGDTNAIAQAAKDPSPAVRRAALLAMRRLEMPEIARFLNDPQPRLRYEAARAINDVPIEAALPELALFVGKVDCPTNILSRAINACFRLGTERHAKMLGAFAGRADVPGIFRARALDALGHWRVEAVTPGHVPVAPERDPRHGETPTVNPENWPGWFDGIVGLWRPLSPRNEQAGKRALLAAGPGVLAGRSEAAKLALIRAAVRLKAKEATHGLFAALSETNTTAAVRREIPGALAALHYSQTGAAVKLALADADLTVRQAGIALLDQVDGAGAAAVLGTLLATETDTRLAQSALTTLGRLPGAEADAVLAAWMEKLAAGQVRAELRLDLLEAAKQRTAPAISSTLQRFGASLPSADALGPWRATLAGGDAARGRDVFQKHAAAQCLRCHTVKGAGGTVGPDLAGIGARQTREQLLEALVFPNKAIAPGFETVVVTLKNGAGYSGIVKSESESELALNTAEDGVVKLKKADLTRRARGLSAMPEGLDKLLTPRELRDLVEYLASLK